MSSMRARLAHCAVSALLFSVVASVSACGGPLNSNSATSPATYYVSLSGNDASVGTSPATAWRTLGRASAALLTPGNRLLLRGGQIFSGQLTVGPHDAGSASDPVIIGSFGGGDAEIFAPTGSGIYVHDTAGVEIHDLDVNSTPHLGGGDGDGINIYNDLPAGHRLDHIVIDNVDIAGFLYGITVGGQNDGSGFGDVEISDSFLHGNIDAGLLTYGPAFNPRSPSYANANVVVTHVVAAQNRGNPNDRAQNTGNGIVLGNVKGGTVVWSTADDNGGLGAASQGPAGIWTYDSTGVDIAHDLSYGNRTPNRVDGNGFGLDQNTSDSVLQYDLSYGNDGTGYLVYSGLHNGSQKNNVVRYDISSGDVRDGSPFYGAVSVIGQVNNVAIYQNTAVMTPTPVGAPPLLRLGPAVHAVSVRNNIFVTESGPIVAVSTARPQSAALLQGNDYFSVLGPWQVLWGQTIYSSLPDWRAGTSQETVDGLPTGLAVDPEMVGRVLGLSVKSPADTDATAGFELRPGSPLMGAGLDLASLGIQAAQTDFIGREQPAAHPNIGAF